MDSLLSCSCEPELVCYICQDLLIENPDSVAVPPPAKRPRVNDGGVEGNCEPTASTSTAATSSETPELCTTPCGHVFHKSCINDWFKRKRECPNCRQKVVTKKLIRIFLPLTAGQCRQCKTRVQQVDEAQLNCGLAQSKAEECAKNEKEWRDKYIQLVQENEDLNEKLVNEVDKVEELQMEIQAEEIGKKLVERQLREEFFRKELDYKKKIEMMEDEQMATIRSNKGLEEQCDKMRREMETLKQKLEEETRKNKGDGHVIDETQQDWKKLFELERFATKAYMNALNYERGKTSLMEEWGKRLSLMNNQPVGLTSTFLNLHCSTELISDKTLAKPPLHQTVIALADDNVNLAVDLEVSDSEDDEDTTQNRHAVILTTNISAEATSVAPVDNSMDNDTISIYSSSSSSSSDSSDSEDDDKGGEREDQKSSSDTDSSDSESDNDN